MIYTDMSLRDPRVWRHAQRTSRLDVCWELKCSVCVP